MIPRPPMGANAKFDRIYAYPVPSYISKTFLVDLKGIAGC
jgi:hypothetical protein